MKARFGLVLGAALSAVAVISASDAVAAGCDVDRPIVFAGLDWDSNAFHTAVARFILEQGYGCETDVIPGSTIPLLTGLARGDIDVMMEIWRDNVTEAWTKAVAAGKVIDLGVNYPDAVQGWYVPRYVREGDKERGIAATAPGLTHVKDLPKYKALFRDPEEPDKGRFYNCILGWSCEVVNTKKLAVYNLTDSYTNFRPGTGAALAAVIASSYVRGKPFVAYYWGPTWVLGKYDLVMLEEPPYDKEIWERMGREDNPSAATAYPIVEVVVGANKAFADSAETVTDFLARYETDNAMISEALAFMQNTPGATAADAARNFLETRDDVWTRWLPAAIADKVKAAIADN